MAMHSIVDYTQKLANTFSKQGTIADVESTSTSSKAYAVGDLFYYEGVLYKVITAIAQGGSIVTTGAGANVKVTSVEEKIKDVEVAHEEDIYGVNANAYPYYQTTKTNHGVTFTDVGDGTITASKSTMDGNASIYCHDRDSSKGRLWLPNGAWRLTGCPVGGSSTEYSVELLYKNSGGSFVYVHDYGDGADFIINDSYENTGGAYVTIYVSVKQTTTMSETKTFKPMISKAYLNLSYDDYRPYNKTAIQNQISAVRDAGAVNKFQHNFTTRTVNGITWTANADGTITANGTASANSSVIVDAVNTIPSGVYNITCCPAGGSSGTYMNTSKINGSYNNSEDYGNGIKNKNCTSFAGFYLSIFSGTTVNNVVFKPMVSDATLNLSYDDYQPHAMTNRELTEAVTAVSSESIESTNTSITATLKLYRLNKLRWIVGMIVPSANGVFATLSSNDVPSDDAINLAGSVQFVVGRENECGTLWINSARQLGYSGTLNKNIYVSAMYIAN